MSLSVTQLGHSHVSSARQDLFKYAFCVIVHEPEIENLLKYMSCCENFSVPLVFFPARW